MAPRYGFNFGAGVVDPQNRSAAPDNQLSMMRELFQMFRDMMSEQRSQQRQGFDFNDLLRATRPVRRDIGGFETAATKAEQAANETAAWNAMFPKITDPAIRASQGMTAENQWAALGQDPARGGVAMSPEQLNTFQGLISPQGRIAASRVDNGRRGYGESRIIPDAPTTTFSAPDGRTYISGAYGTGSVNWNPQPKPQQRTTVDLEAWRAANPETHRMIANEVYAEKGLNDLIRPVNRRKQRQEERNATRPKIRGASYR